VLLHSYPQISQINADELENFPSIGLQICANGFKELLRNSLKRDSGVQGLLLFDLTIRLYSKLSKPKFISNASLQPVVFK